MKQDLLDALEQISTAARVLLEETNLTLPQEKSVLSISTAAHDLVSLIISVSDLHMDSVYAVFSYEGRSALASIIGYVELLLDEEEDPLYDAQRDLVRSIDAQSRYLFDHLAQMEM